MRRTSRAVFVSGLSAHRMRRDVVRLLLIGEWVARQFDREVKCINTVITALRKLGHRRVIPIALAAAWLPYMAMRCSMSPTARAGCHVVPGVVQAHAAEHNGHGDAHRGGSPERADHGKHRVPARTCCDVTGKCEIRAASTVSSADPPGVAAVLPAVVSALAPPLGELRHRPAMPVAHGPPTYLRPLTLRI
jgi:hypothetical protein